MTVRTREIPFLTAVHGEVPLPVAQETLKVIRGYAQRLTDKELTGPLFQQHGKNALSVFEAYEKAPRSGKDAATATLNSYLYYMIALAITRPRREAPELAWAFIFAPSTSWRCPITGAGWLAEALKITVANKDLFNRGREIRIATDAGVTEIEYDAAPDAEGEPGPPVVSKFQAGGKGFAPPERGAIKLWTSIAIRKLEPLFALFNAED